MRTPEKDKLIYSGLSILAYILSFICMHYFFEQAQAFSAIIPVTTVGWCYGSKAGIICALLCFPANSILYTLIGLNWFEKLILSGGGAAGNVALIIMGFIVGRMSSLNMYLKEGLYNRKRTEEKLNETKDSGGYPGPAIGQPPGFKAGLSQDQNPRVVFINIRKNPIR